MTSVSTATTAIGVVYHVFLYKSTYGDMIRSLNRARNYHSQGKFFCIIFTNPLTGARTKLTGSRIIEIFDKPSSIVWKSIEEQTAGLVIQNLNFFSNVLGSYYQAQKHRNQLNLYCKTINIPSSLFPNVSAKELKSTLTGHQLLLLMCAALGNTGIPESLDNNSGEPVDETEDPVDETEDFVP
jgi:hypothetical protein